MLTERPNKKFAQLSVADDAFRPKRVLPPFQHPTPRNKPKKKEREVVAKKIQDMTQFRNKVPKVVLAEDEVYFTEERVAALQRKAKLLEVLFYPFFNPKSTRDILGQHFFMELTVLLLDSN